MLIWEAYHVSKLNEYYSIEKAKKNAEAKLKRRR